MQKIIRDILIGLGLICLIIKFCELSELLIEGSSRFTIFIILALIGWSLSYKKD